MRITRTAITTDGSALIGCRGIQGDKTITDLVTGYQPVLMQRTDVDGKTLLAPYNLVTSFFWVYEDADGNLRPVRKADLEVVYLANGAYIPDILSAFDANNDGLLDNAELELNTTAKQELIKGKLESLGLKNVHIYGQVQPYSINHNVVSGEYATRECTTCHNEDTRVNSAIALTVSGPTGITPQFVADTNVAVSGEIINIDGTLMYQPASENDGIYVFGHNRIGWIDWFGALAFLGTLFGVAGHGTMRYLAGRKHKHEAATKPVYMYEVYERFWHWLQTIGIVTLLLTGLIIHRPDLFGSVSLSLLDFNLVWVNPTYLWSGIIGGLIMGVGFIVGGFCPTTSLASASTGKIDGMLFMLGGFGGAFLFGETESLFDGWHNTAGYFGRVTLDQVFGLPIGVVVLLVVFMALFMFWGSEQMERIIGKRDMSHEPKIRLVGAGLLAAAAIAIVFIGSPSLEEKYARVQIARTVEGEQVKLSADKMLAKRMVQVHPGELLKTMADDRLRTIIIDVRPENEYNLFHIKGAVNIPLSEITNFIPAPLEQQALNTVYVVVSNDETAATEGWKMLVASSVPNVYILEGGINNWIAVFGESEDGILPISTPIADALHYAFNAALGDRYACADPSPLAEWEIEYEPKIQLQLKRDKSGGGCG